MSASDKKLEMEYQAIIDLIKGRMAVRYSNYVLEGPKDVPIHPVAIAALYPKDSILPPYRLISLDSGQTISRGKVQNKILHYTPRQEALELQRDLSAMWINMNKEDQQIAIELRATLAQRIGIPLTFILFGRTETGNQLTAHIYHPPMLPTEVCLKMLQDGVRGVIAKDN